MWLATHSDTILSLIIFHFVSALIDFVHVLQWYFVTALGGEHQYQQNKQYWERQQSASHGYTPGGPTGQTNTGYNQQFQPQTPTYQPTAPPPGETVTVIRMVDGTYRLVERAPNPWATYWKVRLAVGAVCAVIFIIAFAIWGISRAF